MKQHPIPQNILDIEFKLFSKFTIKEFVYIAIGVGFGSIFLFMMSTGAMPAIIALPLFIVLSGGGLFLGLVKLNDQKADVYLKNFILAITTPTQRVWRNKEFDDKFAKLNPELGAKPDLPKSSNNNIVAGNTEVIAHNYADQNSLSSLDIEEQEKLKNIADIAEQTKGEIIKPVQIELPVQTPAIDVAPTSLPTPTPEPIPAPELIPPIEPTLIPEPVPLPEPIPTPEAIPTLEPSLVPEPIPAPELIPLQQAIQTPEVVPQQTPSINPISSITIGSHNIQDYQLPLANFPQVTNAINMLLLDTNSKPVAKAIVMIKDSLGKIANVKVSNQSGLVITGKQFTSDKYQISIQHESYTFPEITFILEGGVYPPIRVKAIK